MSKTIVSVSSKKEMRQRLKAEFKSCGRGRTEAMATVAVVEKGGEVRMHMGVLLKTDNMTFRGGDLSPSILYHHWGGRHRLETGTEKELQVALLGGLWEDAINHVLGVHERFLGLPAALQRHFFLLTFKYKGGGVHLRQSLSDVADHFAEEGDDGPNTCLYNSMAILNAAAEVRGWLPKELNKEQRDSVRKAIRQGFASKEASEGGCNIPIDVKGVPSGSLTMDANEAPQTR